MLQAHESKRPPLKHYWTAPARPGNRRLKRNAIAKACNVLLPWENRVDYPGLYRGAVDLFKNRVALHTIKNWLAGRRRMPDWAREILLDRLRQLAGDVAKAIAALENEKGRS